MDFISCRNVLIYMDPFIQKKALTTFHYALSDKGFLLLGKSDSAAQVAELFEPVLKASKVYSRRQAPSLQVRKAILEMDASSQITSGKGLVIAPIINDFVKSGLAILMADFTPASVIINEHLDVMHLSGNTEPFMQLSPGLPTFNLLKIVRKGLTFELRNILRKAKDLNVTVVKAGIPFKSGEELLDVTIEIRKLSETAEPYFLVVFTSFVIPKEMNTKFIGLIHDQINNDNINLKRIRALEKELLQTQADVNTISTEHEAFNGELQSANEELLSGTEELQSLNEELETSKEELQSSNEELIITNTELIEKQEQINSSKAYIEAIIATLREPIVVLDKNLQIKNINRAFVKKYHITKEEARTQHIYKICDGLFENEMMRSMLEKVLPQRIQLDDFEIALNRNPEKECILLLNAKQITNEHGEEQLILLAIEDITERKIIERDLKSLSDGFEAKVKERTEESGPAYVQHDYILAMEYNNNHTIKKKTQSHTRGATGAYGTDPITNSAVTRTNYTLDYSGYGTGAFSAGNATTSSQNYGWVQPHAVRKVTESPTPLPNEVIAANDPRIRFKEFKYDAAGNQTEIKEKVGEKEIILRKNLWDEENRLMGVDLKPDDPTDRPVAVYTYDAGGERVIRHNFDRSDVYSNSAQLASGYKDNIMIYPSGLLMAKIVHYNDRKKIDKLQYTKHYYIGAERISAKAGTLDFMGYFPFDYVNSDMADLNNSNSVLNLTQVKNNTDTTQTEARKYVMDVFTKFQVTPPPSLTDIPVGNRENLTNNTTFHIAARINHYYFHPDHLGSSSYVTGRTGVVTQHMEYLPFGETLTDEHINSKNSPFKYNGKEFDEETGNYYYSARYYDPKLSIFISVDPLWEHSLDKSPYHYCSNNPINRTDPSGMCDDPACPHSSLRKGWDAVGRFFGAWGSSKPITMQALL